ncbi:MAG: AtpZ/AtpI family protein [Chitinophagaceae bacterium]|nr:AtpZ/AtpI family protein [Chitinophagaceae bacterium]
MIKDRRELNKTLMRYASMGSQFFVAIGAGVWGGLKLDEWLKISFPLLVWLLPLILIIGIILKIILETNKK